MSNDDVRTLSTLSDLDERAWSLMAETLPPVPPDPAERARLLHELVGRERFLPFAAEMARAFDLPRTVAEHALRAMHEPSAWQPALFGTSAFATPALREAGVALVRYPSTLSFPKHGHVYRERVYILQGGLLENEDQVRGPGDLMDMAIGTEHSIRVADDHECLVVFALGD